VISKCNILFNDIPSAPDLVVAVHVFLDFKQLLSVVFLLALPLPDKRFQSEFSFISSINGLTEESNILVFFINKFLY
jgi:hypothetical protein